MTRPPDTLSHGELVAQLRRRNDELAALDAIGRLAAASPDLGRVLEEAGQIVQAQTGCAGLAVFTQAEGAAAIELLHHRGIPEGLVARLGSLPVAPPFLFSQADPAADAVDPAIYPEPIRAVFREGGVTALARVPLVVGARAVGILAAAFVDRPPSEAAAHLRFLRAAGALLGAVINADRLLSSVRRRVAELTLVNDLAIASAQLDPAYLLEGAVKRMAEAFGAAMGAAFLLQGDTLLNVAMFGVRPEVQQAARRVPLDAGALGLAIRRREVVAVPDAESSGGLFAQHVRGEGLRAGVAVPLLTKDRAIGAFVLARRDERPFSAEERAFLRTLGAQLSVTVENSRLYAEARRQVAHLESMHALALRVFIHPPGDQVALLRDGCKEIAAALDAPTAAAFLVSEDRRTLRCLALHGTADGFDRLSLPIDGDRLAAEAVREGQVGQTPDSGRDPGGGLAGEPGTPSMSLLVVPLGSRDVGRGVVFVGDRTGRTFDDREVALARAMASALAVGLDNADLEVDLGRSHAELERAQAQLVHRERLAALGAVSAAVAHEVRNPLGVIFNAVGMLRQQVGTSPDASALVGMIGEEAERLNRIVTDLLGFARPAASELRPTPLGPLVEEAVRAALATHRAPVEVAWEHAAGLPPVAVDAGLVRQAVINVVLNAAQAMGRGGRLRVRTASEGDAAAIEVIDAGPGIPDELRERIFEPFFTTKPSGTGLGLAIVKHVVELHGGGVEAAPAPGGGTRFTLRFPIAAPAGTTPAAG